MKELIERHFSMLGFKVIYYNNKPSANGEDAFVIKDGNLNAKPLSVEIKKARFKKNGIVEVEPVLETRKKDDLIAIVIKDYVLIESMKDHLNNCSKKGTRNFTILK